MEELERNLPKGVIGTYSIGKTIGRGTFGKVKLGTHLLSQLKVAIKILEKNKILDVADVERVTREIHILKLTRHPHIIQLYEIIETSKRLYLIMEYVPGGELFDYIVSSVQIPEEEACRFFQELIAGIEYLHKLGICHRDLKPENLLLDEKKSIRIVDFGLSNTYSESELLKTACGSPCYAAPEMIAGKKYEGVKADIWSAGIILFAMVCGYLPFEHHNTSKLYEKILAGKYEFSSKISENVKDLLERILENDPAIRISLDEIKRHEWFSEISSDSNSGILIGFDEIKVDKRILKKLKDFNYDLEYAKRCIEANKHNNITALYFLLNKHYPSLSNDLKEKRKINLSQTQSKTLPFAPQPPLIKISHKKHPYGFRQEEAQPLKRKRLKISISPLMNNRRSPHVRALSQQDHKPFTKELRPTLGVATPRMQKTNRIPSSLVQSTRVTPPVVFRYPKKPSLYS